MAANYFQIYNSFYGTFTYGPVTDGSFVPDQPLHLLAVGDFDRRVKVMVGHNADEGLAFTPPNADNATVWSEFLANTLPLASKSTLNYITNTLYPPVYDGSQGYTNAVGRGAKAISELIFTCNTFYLDEAYSGRTYAYEFAVPPALHGQDVGWTYFTGNEATPNAKPSPFNPYAVTNVTVAIALQKFITSFAERGVPEAMGGVPRFVPYGKDARVEILNQTSISIGHDDVSKKRCQWWQSGAFLGPHPWRDISKR
jgi:carboxylesterase type B